MFKHEFTYWAHSEQLLLACLGSDDGNVRARAVACIISLRNSMSPATEPPRKKKNVTHSVRMFELPSPIYSASHFSTMIDWDTEQVTEPPFLRKFTTPELRYFESHPLFLDIPSNFQFVERFIRLITENSTRAATSSVRDGLCHATARHRQQHGKKESKADFSN